MGVLPFVNKSEKMIVTGSEPKIKIEGPDGRMAWIVAISACVINFIMAGLGRMSGILFVAFIELYGVDRKSASMPFSVRSSARNLLGPVVGILGQKYGIRSINIIGGIVATTSALACFFADDITWITVLWGAMNGLGNSLTVTLPQVILGQYFDVYRTTASGMAFSGGCVGSFLFPALLDVLLPKYGVEGTFLIIGGIIMHTIPAAMIFRAPPWLKRRSEVESASDVECPKPPKIVVTEDVGVKDKMDTTVTVKIPKSKPNMKFLWEQGRLVTRILLKLSSNRVDMTVSEIDNDKSVRLESCIREELKDLLKSVEIPLGMSLFHQNLSLAASLTKEPIKTCNSMRGPDASSPSRLLVPCGLKKSKSAPDLSKITVELSNNKVLTALKKLQGMKFLQILALCPNEDKRKVNKVSRELRKLHNFIAKLNGPRNVQVSVNSSHSNPSAAETTETRSHSNSFWDHIKTAVKLHSNPVFLLICLCRAVHFVAFIPVMTFVVDFVMDKGFLEADGKYAIAAISLGDLVGRLCFGWVTDKGFLSMPKYMMIVMIAQGACTAFLPLMYTKITLFLGLCLFGLLEGSLFVRHPVLVSKYMKSHEQSIAMGCINFFAGLLGFLLPIYIGYFRDTLGSYDYIFHINGALGVLVGLFWILEPYLLQCSERTRDEPDGSV